MKRNPSYAAPHALALIVALIATNWVTGSIVHSETTKAQSAPIIRRVETCSPRSIDAYPPIELRRIAAARETDERNRRRK